MEVHGRMKESDLACSMGKFFPTGTDMCLKGSLERW